MLQWIRSLLRLNKEKHNKENLPEDWEEPKGPFQIVPMSHDDLDEVVKIEKLAFRGGSWSRWAFASELRRGPDSCFLVAKVGDRVVGFGGWQREYQEAHIVNIAVHPRMQGRKIGEAIFRRLLEEALRRGLSQSILEVRASNTVAQNLYKKYGFQVIGLRRWYYFSPKEDGLVMRLNDIRQALERVPKTLPSLPTQDGGLNKGAVEK
ncbi:MAG: ribosomal protein S18-alanine N-acetyltransferase [Armatimonadetes bacterium]|nr:ribosomal protein S18-alanine N-acetyltransferase [Armatimonadota bacterium]MDW8121533.1 ribosomal protein S18-alanine N-acetyltransferase [Armatimonadota bacterium]